MIFHGERQQDKWRDFAAGITMGISMLPVFVLVPLMLREVGMDFAGAYTAAILAALLGTLVMGLVHVPLAVMPSVAVSSYLVYLTGISQGLSWQQLLGAGFVASGVGLLFACLPVSRHCREAVPPVIGRLIPGGIGVMLITMGLIQSRILIRSPWNVSMLGNFQDPMAYLGLMGILLTLVMMAMQLRGALLFGFMLTTSVSYAEGFWALPDALFMLPEGLDKVAWQINLLPGNDSEAVKLAAVVLTLLVVWGSMNWAGLQILPSESQKKAKSLAAIFAVGGVSSLGGSIPVSLSPLSAVGSSCGGRGLLTVLGTSLLLAAALFCEPVLRSLADFPVMVVPVLVGAGFMLIQRMVSGFCHNPVEWRLPELAAAVSLLLVMPLSGSMAAGLGCAVIGYCLLRGAAGEGKKIPLASWILAALFILYFVYAAL
ncbi:MAG: NCS2 family permease [Selenomonadaceae bacterium]|nr:NCS2 family permease [Selenomonadaceae bacterium]